MSDLQSRALDVELDTTETILKVNYIFYSVLDERVEKYIVLVILEGFLSLFGIISNLLVLVINLAVPSLRNRKTTTLIMSLSVSDLCVSGLVMTFSTFIRIHTVTINMDNDRNESCYTWVTITIAVCTASSLNVCVISVDRYILITYPLHYDNYITGFRIKVFICTVWIISFGLAFFTLVLGIGHYEHQHLQNTNISSEYTNESITLNANVNYMTFIAHCHQLPSKNYIIGTVILIVFLPCLIVTIVYLQIVKLVIKQSKFIRKENEQAKRFHVAEIRKVRSAFTLIGLQHYIVSSISEKAKRYTVSSQHEDANFTIKTCTSQPMLSHSGAGPDPQSSKYITSDICKQSTVNSLSAIQDMSSLNVRSNGFETATNFRLPENDDTTRRNSTGLHVVSLIMATSDVNNVHPRKISSIRELITQFTSLIAKASKPELKKAILLMVIAGTYVVCWLPFGIVSIIQTTQPRLARNLREAFLWLAYSNSCWNPVIYAMLNTTFRTSAYALLVQRRLLRNSENSTKYGVKNDTRNGKAQLRQWQSIRFNEPLPEMRETSI